MLPLLLSLAVWVPPVPGPVLHGFAPPAVRWAAGHRGVDLAAAAGAPVRAAGDGVVAFAGPLAGRGVVVVAHGTLRTTYEPVAAAVHVGDRVRAGQLLGRLQPAARGHCGVRPCLHWGLLRGRVYLDPLALLGRSAVRLLPVLGLPPPAAGAPVAAARPRAPAHSADPGPGGAARGLAAAGLGAAGGAAALLRRRVSRAGR